VNSQENEDELKRILENRERQIISTWILPNTSPRIDEKKIRERIVPFAQDFCKGIKETFSNDSAYE